MTILEGQALAAKVAARVLSVAGTAQKNKALEAIAQALLDRQEEILSANARDLDFPVVNVKGICRATVIGE